jgi:type IV pilus assembly protein PilB
MGLFSEPMIRTQKILPLFRLNNTLNLAISDPLNSGPINAARDATGLKIDPVIALKHKIENAIDLHHGISGYVDIESSSEQSINIANLFDETRVIELVDSIITQSKKYSCSDIHIEPRENNIRVRFRIDGRLQDFQSLPRDIHTALVSRLKIMARFRVLFSRKSGSIF